MSYSVLSTHKFEKELKHLSKKFPSLKKEFGDLIRILSTDPFEGTSIGHNCYKIRLAISSKGKGKSGGARVITYVYVAEKTIYLLAIYDKSEQSAISDLELRSRIKSI